MLLLLPQKELPTVDKIAKKSQLVHGLCLPHHLAWVVHSESSVSQNSLVCAHLHFYILPGLNPCLLQISLWGQLRTKLQLRSGGLVGRNYLANMTFPNNVNNLQIDNWRITSTFLRLKFLRQLFCLNTIFTICFLREMVIPVIFFFSEDKSWTSFKIVQCHQSHAGKWIEAVNLETLYISQPVMTQLQAASSFC